MYDTELGTAGAGSECGVGDLWLVSVGIGLDWMRFKQVAALSSSRGTQKATTCQLFDASPPIGV